MRVRRDHDRPLRILVQVSAADAAPERCDQHLAGARMPGFAHLVDPDVPGAMEYCGAHGSVHKLIANELEFASYVVHDVARLQVFGEHIPGVGLDF
jgi:hypothetical protein